MIPKLPRWIWPIGLALIILNSLLFVLECVESTPTHSSLESTVLIIGLTVGSALVAGYWGAKWMRLRTAAIRGSSLLSRISWRYRILIGIGLLALLALGIQGTRMSFNPALQKSEDFVRANKEVLASYGPITDLTIDALFWNAETAPDGTSVGKYTFELSGKTRTGTVQIHWRDDYGVYTATEIDDLPDGDLLHPQTIWKSK